MQYEQEYEVYTSEVPEGEFTLCYEEWLRTNPMEQNNESEETYI